MTLDLSSFKKAISSLEEALKAQEEDPDNMFILDSCIQRFEYTYGLSGKMLKRYLEETEDSSDIIDEMSFPDLIRTGCEKGLILSDWPQWKEFRNARNITSHTYDEKKAWEVFRQIPALLKDAQFLFNKIKERQEK